MDDKKEAQAEGGRRFQTEGTIMEKDLDIIDELTIDELTKP